MTVRLILFFLVFTITLNSNAQQYKRWEFDPDEIVRIELNKLNLYDKNIEDLILEHQLYDKKKGALVNAKVNVDRLENDSILVCLTKENGNISCGTIHRKHVEKYPFPKCDYINPEMDSSFYIDLLNQFSWKKRYDTLHYSKTMHMCIYQDWANVEYLKENYQKAIYLFSSAIKLKQTNFLLSRRAYCKQMVGDHLGCLKDIEKIIKQPIEQWETKRSLNLHCPKSGFYIADMMNPAFRKDQILAIRAVSLFQTKSFSQTILDINKAIEINNKDPYYYFLRALAKYNSGNRKGACLDLSLAGEMGYKEAFEKIKELCTF